MLKLLAVFSVIAVAAASEGPFEVAAATQKYLVSNITIQFIDAFATCKRYGYKLASEQSIEDTENINAAIIGAGHNNSLHYLGGYFEHSDGLFSGDWIWLETGESFNYSSWYSAAPTDTWYCLTKLPMGTYSLKWTASHCDSPRYFICEK